MTQLAVGRITRTQESAALAFLGGAPYENVFLTWLITADRSSSTRSVTYLCSGGGEVTGVAYFGRQVVIAARDDAVSEAFAGVAPAHRNERMIVAPRRIVERYWRHVSSWHAPARITRPSQPLLALRPSELSGSAGGVVGRRARPSEWESVAYNSAKMIEHELEYDPRSFAPDFNANVRQMIDRGLWWVGESDGKLCFFCNAGPRSTATLQLQGIWTPPRLRGQGLASRALYAICEQLLQSVPSISLYVNDFNEKALALYDRLGFERVGEFASLLF